MLWISREICTLWLIILEALEFKLTSLQTYVRYDNYVIIKRKDSHWCIYLDTKEKWRVWVDNASFPNGYLYILHLTHKVVLIFKI